MKSMVKLSLGFLLVIILSLFVSAAPALAADFALETDLKYTLLDQIDISYEWAISDNVAYFMEYSRFKYYDYYNYYNESSFILGTNIYFMEGLKGLYIGTTSSLHFFNVYDEWGDEYLGVANGVGLNLGCRLILGRRSGLSLNGGVGINMLFNWYYETIDIRGNYYLKMGIAL